MAKDETRALRFNSDKPQLHYILFYPKFLEAFAKVQEQGAHKYGYGNWRYGGKPNAEYFDSAMRHIVDHANGDIYDEDAGVLVLAQAVWNLINAIERNMQDVPVLDPDFDQEAYIEKWADHPKQEGPTIGTRLAE